MSITKETELIGMKKASEAVACTLKEMRDHAHPGMTTKQLYSPPHQNVAC